MEVHITINVLVKMHYIAVRFFDLSNVLKNIKLFKINNKDHTTEIRVHGNWKREEQRGLWGSKKL